MLAFCDELERHPDKYEREKILVKLTPSNDGENCGDKERTVECWCYFFKKYNEEHLKIPMIANYCKDEVPIYDIGCVKNRTYCKCILISSKCYFFMENIILHCKYVRYHHKTNI